MHAYTELRERRHALLFTVEQGCRRQGIRQWETLRRYLLAVMSTSQGRALLIDAVTVDEYITQRQERIVHKHQSSANHTAGCLLAARDHQLAESFMQMVNALPPVDSAVHATR